MSTPQAEPVRVLQLDAIVPDHWPNPRGPIDTESEKFLELQASIAAQGILEPIVVGPAVLDGGRHPIIAGWRRYTAAKLGGLDTVPVHEKPKITTAHAALRAACAENMAREDMTPLAEANAIARLMELGDTQAQAAAALGVSERTARERLRLLTLPAPVQKAIDTGTIPSTAGRQLQVIADVSPKAAGALTKQITAGKLRASVLLDAQLTRQALAGVRRDAGLLALEHNTQVAQLPLPPAVLKQIKARARKAAEHSYGGDWLDLSPTAVGKKLLQEAKDAGKILAIAGEHGETLYVGDPAWIERVTTAALERAEKRAADRKRERERQQAKINKGAEHDPAERAAREHEHEQATIHSNAQPFAAAMNVELGQRLRELRACTIEGAVARLLVHLAVENEYVTPIARDGFALVDPEHRYVTCSDQNLHALFDSDVEHADSPEAAAAIIVSAYVAFAYADRRAIGGKGLYASHYMHDDTTPLVRAAAESLGVLPDRAQRLDEARRAHAAAVAYHRDEGDRRRVLHELTKASRKGLQRDPLYERAKQFDNDATTTGATVQVWQHHTLDRVLEQLKVAGHITVDESEDAGGAIARHYRVSPEGRKALRAPMPPAPLFPSIDVDEPTTSPQSDVVIVHVAAPHGGNPVEAELQPDRQSGRPNVRKVIYTESRTAAWVAVTRIVDLPDDDLAAVARAKPAGTRTEQALAYITAHPGITIPELAEKMTVKHNHLYRLLPGLASDGKIHKRGRGWFPAGDTGGAAAAAA